MSSFYSSCDFGVLGGEEEGEGSSFLRNHKRLNLFLFVFYVEAESHIVA